MYDGAVASQFDATYTPPAMADTRVLNSWKEISNYIGRGVRTVQRWEEHYGLPVHRPSGRDRSAVYALVDEVDAWLKAGATHQKPAGAKKPLDPQVYAYCEHLINNAGALRERLRKTRAQAEEIRLRINEARKSRQAEATAQSQNFRKAS
jgi:phage terminase Nu1 subunit (DNA packaging protein)